MPGSVSIVTLTAVTEAVTDEPIGQVSYDPSDVLGSVDLNRATELVSAAGWVVVGDWDLTTDAYVVEIEAGTIPPRGGHHAAEGSQQNTHGGRDD